MNPETGGMDTNQDKLVNVHLGLDKYGYFGTYKLMGNMLENQKLLRRKIGLES